jgi:hypothetical protein
MHHPSVFCSRSAGVDRSTSSPPGPEAGPIFPHRKNKYRAAVIRFFARTLLRLARFGPWPRTAAASIFAGLVMVLIPGHIQAAQVTLAWGAGVPAPDGYRVFQREEGTGYDYAKPVWLTDGADHPESSCTISNLAAGTIYYFVVRAHAGGKQSRDSNEVTFPALEDDDEPPIAEAGINRSVTAGSTVILNGSGSSHPDRDVLSYQWVQKSGTNVALSGTNSARCTFTAPDLKSASDTLVFQLTVTDSKGQFGGDTCLVMVQPAQLPDNGDNGITQDPDSDDDNEGLAGGDPNQADDNRPPEQPTLNSPVDGDAAIGLTPLLQAGAFIDPDGEDNHAKTQWRITLSADSQEVVLERTCEAKNLTDFQVPYLVLDPSTRYSAQVRYYDGQGEPSPWSWPVLFTTAPDPQDKNRNRIPDSQEVSADTDMNGDAMPDIKQKAVIKAVTTYNALHVIAVGIENSETAIAVESAASIDPTALESAFNPADQTPYGLLGYKLRLNHPGESTRAIIYLSDPVDRQQAQWVRYCSSDGIQNCSASTVISENGLSVHRYLVDGGDEDADGTVNGIIVDLSGPWKISSSGNSSLAISNDSHPAPAGGSSGCFVDSLIVHSILY